MDVLEGSIDVRDLLAAADIDAASPLSAPDLRLLIDRLHARSLHIKDRVRSRVLAHRDDFASIFARCSAAASRSETLASALSDALRLLSDRPVDVEIRVLAAEIGAKARELEERRQALELVRRVHGFLEGLEASREYLRQGRMVQAAEKVSVLKTMIGGEEGEGELEVCRLLRNEWIKCSEELIGFLAMNVEKAVQFDVENMKATVICRWRIGGEMEFQLQNVLTALEIVGSLDYGLAKIADTLLKIILVPVISATSNIVSVADINEIGSETIGSTLTLLLSSEFQGYDDGSVIYSRVIEVIKFVQRYICFDNSSWTQCFGRLMWARLSDTIISCFLSKVVPDDASKMAGFENVARQTIKFESALKELMFISETPGKDAKLSHFAHNVEVHFASRKRNEILVKSRNLLVQCDYRLPPELTRSSFHAARSVDGLSDHFADLIFHGETCLISNAANQLMALVHKTLKDACLSSTRVAREFYHAARDSLLLYKAIVPVKLEKQLNGVCQEAGIVYNDFIYLAQETLGLAFEYRADFPSGLREQATFLDIALNFCQCAREVLQKQIHLVRNSLKEAIDSANGFQNTHQPQQFELAKFSIDQVVFTLEKVHIIWEPLMPVSTYKKSICNLLEFLFSEITKDMLLLDDIAAEETLQIQRLIQIMLENLSSLLESLLLDTDEKERYLHNNDWAVLEEMIPSLSKIRKLADLFDMPLRSITTKWESRELVACGFTFSEVDNFVKAVFSDSPLRKECLLRIENTST